MYDYMLTEAEKRFFGTDMNGTDWKAMGKAYRRFLPTSATTPTSPNSQARSSARSTSPTPEAATIRRAPAKPLPRSACSMT